MNEELADKMSKTLRGEEGGSVRLLSDKEAELLRQYLNPKKAQEATIISELQGIREALESIAYNYCLERAHSNYYKIPKGLELKVSHD